MAKIERVYDGKWGKSIDEWNEWARRADLAVDFHDPHVMLGGTQERPFIVIEPFTEEETERFAVPPSFPVEEIATFALDVTEFGLWVCVENRAADFWVYLGSPVGWGRFSRVKNRFPHMNEWTFELVEVRPLDAEHPSKRTYWKSLHALR